MTERNDRGWNGSGREGEGMAEERGRGDGMTVGESGREGWDGSGREGEGMGWQ